MRSRSYFLIIPPFRQTAKTDGDSQFGQLLRALHELDLLLHVARRRGLVVAVLVLRLVLGRRELLRVGQVVDGDGQEDVEQGVVAEEREDDEVEAVDHPGAVAALGLDPLVHDLVPVLAGQHLLQRDK